MYVKLKEKFAVLWPIKESFCLEMSFCLKKSLKNKPWISLLGRKDRFKCFYVLTFLKAYVTPHDVNERVSKRGWNDWYCYVLKHFLLFYES